MSNDPTFEQDCTRRFLFEDSDIRGELVQLNDSYRAILGIHQYAPGVARLLGEFLAASVLLATTLKFEGKLVLQARSDGQIPLLMVECDSELHIRAIARGAQAATSERFDQLLSDGQLAITIDPDRGRRYQGIVPLLQDSLAHSLAAYFKQSEQLGTRLWLVADGARAAGMLLQQLPAQRIGDSDERQQQWEHACTLADTLRENELLGIPATAVIHRLYHGETLRLFDAKPVLFRCSCSRERTLNALASLPTEEVEELLQELGSITMDCEFCNQQYRFNREDLGAVLGGDEATILH